MTLPRRIHSGLCVFGLMWILVLEWGCSSRTPNAENGSSRSVSFEWNFLGVCATNWSESFRFYSETLGIQVRSQDGPWAVFGTGWDRYRAGKSRALVWELFQRPLPVASQDVGRSALEVELGIQVSDLEKAVAFVRSRGVVLVRSADGEVSNSASRFRFDAPGGTSWFLESRREAVSNMSSVGSLAEPEILSVEFRVRDFLGQRAFYEQVLGLNVLESKDSRLLLGQNSGGPRLVLKKAREQIRPRDDFQSRKYSGPPALCQPVFLGFMTPNVKAAAESLRKSHVRVLQDVEHHDWGGTDLIVADADGNAVQVFSLDSAPRFGERQQAARIFPWLARLPH